MKAYTLHEGIGNLTKPSMGVLVVKTNRDISKPKQLKRSKEALKKIANFLDVDVSEIEFPGFPSSPFRVKSRYYTLKHTKIVK